MGALSLCCCTLCHADSNEPPGCVFFETHSDDKTDNWKEDLPGLRVLDFTENYQNALITVLTELSDLFQVKVAFGFYDDDVNNPNARPLQHTTLSGLSGISPSDGAVAVGRHLVEQIRKKEQGTRYFGAALTAVCAHEFGHILQFKYILPQLMQIQDHLITRAELHADFICGYFAAFRKRQQPDYPAAMQAMTQFRYGDGAYQQIDHGSPNDRGNAVYAGFLLNQGKVLSPEDVTLKGLEYVMGLSL
jgi:hypothetical protein